MVIGIGVDIVNVDRIFAACSNKICPNNSFLKKYFTESEISLFIDKGINGKKSLAGNFALKEAVSKALGTGVSGFGLIDIEILRNEKGAPFVSLHGNASKIAMDLCVINWHVSVSYSDNCAIGFAICEG